MFFIGGCIWFFFGDEQRWTLISVPSFVLLLVYLGYVARSATLPWCWGLSVWGMCSRSDRGLDECARIRLAVERPGVTGPGHTGSAPGLVTIDTSPQIIRGLESGVGGLGGVAGIT